MLFTDEVLDMDELIDKLTELDGIDQIKVGVVCFIFDQKGNLILHRRGPGARDEVGKLLAIGGSVNNTDFTFRDAMERELREECGENAVISVDDFLGAQLDGKIDNTTGTFVNWIILGYKGKLVSGDLINNEPDRCIGFEKNTMDNFLTDEVSTTAKNFIKYMMEKN